MITKLGQTTGNKPTQEANSVVPAYKNLADATLESFQFLIDMMSPQHLSIEELGIQEPKIGLHYYHIPTHRAYIAIFATPIPYNQQHTQLNIAVYGEHNTGFFYVSENPTQPIGDKLRELVLGLKDD